MLNFLSNKKNYLIVLGVIINVSFFVSAFATGWYNYFFFGSSVHYCCRGLDFFAVPNGAYSFYHGGDFSGKMPYNLPPYSIGFPSNLNLYHPFFTLFMGSFFLIFQPNVSFYLWMGIKLIITLTVAYYIFLIYRKSSFMPFAVFLFLTNFSQYNEIKISQYQFLFNIFLLFFLIALEKNKHVFKASVFFLITLLVKPIGLLWIPVLAIRRQFSLIAISLLLFVVLTIPFVINNTGTYYINNLTNVFFHPVFANTIDIMSLEAFLRNALGFSPFTITLIKGASLAAIISLAFSKRISFFKCIFLLVVYFLSFYDLVYQYHFSILGPVFAYAVLTDRDFQTKASRILMLAANGPTVFFILRFFRFHFVMDPFLGPNPTHIGWEIVSFFQFLPLLLLVFVAFTKPVAASLDDIKRKIVHCLPYRKYT